MIAKDILAALAALATGLAFYLLAEGLQRGSNGFPQAVAAIMMGAGLVILGRAVLRARRRMPARAEDAQIGQDDTTSTRMLLFMAMSLAYVPAVHFLGFHTSSFVFILATGYLFGERRWYVLVPSALAFLGVIVLLFNRMMHTPLPAERLLDLLGF